MNLNIHVYNSTFKLTLPSVYAYNTPELIDVVFKKVKIINKGNYNVEDMYLAYWADDNLGFAGDDFVGCDSLLSLSYTYNGDNFDVDNFGEAPPAIGRLLLQGPIVPSEKDTAKINDKLLPGYKNLPKTSFIEYISGDPKYRDAEIGIPAGSDQLYNNFRGKLWDGSDIFVPNTSRVTNFCVPGDPQLKTGWYEGKGWIGGPSKGDRRTVMASGPFNLNPGESQEVVFAILVARGTDNINSVTKLKEIARYLHEYWGNDIPTDIEESSFEIPVSYSLSQNYPNPFNPTTTIEYSIPEMNNVQITIYNVLGQEIATLVNEVQPPGSYKVVWDASNVASGIYLYRITYEHNSLSKKMLLIK